MDLNNRHIFYVENHKDAIYVDGISGDLLNELILYFSEFNTSVFQPGDLTSSVRFTYVFQKDNLKNLVRNVRISSESGAKFILLISDSKPAEKNKAQKLMSQIHSGVEWYLVFVPKIHGREQAKLFVSTLFKKISLMKKTHMVQTSPSRDKKIQTNNFKFPVILTSVFLFITIVSLYFSAVVGSIFFGINQLEKASDNYKSGNLKEANSHAIKAEKIFSFGWSLSSPILAVGKKVSYADSKAIEDSFQTGKLTAKTVTQALYVTQLGKQIGESILSSRTTVAQSEFETITTEVEKLDIDIKHLTTQVTALRETDSKLFSFFNIKPRINEAEKYLENINNVLHLSTRFVHIMPSLLGYNSPKTFLILFQNNAELRPTGGFIGSFGWVTFSQGRLVEFKTEDVYTADGQLKGHVPPPEAIAKYLAQENWYLRDSNFDPDFSISAQQAEWFLKHEMNLTFDGVIALDLQSVQELLRGMDGIYIPDYNQTITADNLFLETQSISELGFFPGSTQKRDFIGSLTRSIFIKMTSGEIEWGKMLAALKTSLDEKHVLFYLHDENGQELIEEAGWGGRLASVPDDYLMIVEANLGINKSNFLVDRSIDLSITKKAGILEHNLSTTYVNESKESTYPGGQYFSYTRLLIPQSAQLDSIKVGSKLLAKEDIKEEIYQDKKMIGFPMTIPAVS
ncbi:DUF4012 domain-containing protein, partial [Candidatus Gottesmanbacteria bacterium]|nr:DUF4012 domain-containing protein [Candidatus Gottesmanbacteria bacterium]